MEFLAETVRSWESEVVHSISTAGGTFEVTADKYLRGSAFSHRWHRGDRWADTHGFHVALGRSNTRAIFPLEGYGDHVDPDARHGCIWFRVQSEVSLS